MRQYSSVKAKYPDTILLFRMGDFYETFEEDARVSSRVLGITLTKRGNGTSREIPLAGFPYHALESYMPRLLKAGYRVAVCEQTEDPKFAKGIVKRDVIEVATPGIAFSDKLLERKQNNYLAAIFLPSPLVTGTDIVGLAFVDITTAEFCAGELSLNQLRDQIPALNPAELLVGKRDAELLRSLLTGRFNGVYTKLDDWIFNTDYAYELLTRHFNTQTLKGFGIEEMKTGVVAAGAVMNYLQETQKANLLHLKKIAPYNASEYILLDHPTKRNLEISTSIDGHADGTLFSVLDRTRTPMGGRLLHKWIDRPLRKPGPILERQEGVAEFAGAKELRATVRSILENIGDLERLISKICTNRATPRDVVAMKTSLSQVEHLKSRMTPASRTLSALHRELQPPGDVVAKIALALTDDPPATLADGGVLKPGYDAGLDELRSIATSGKSWIANLQKTERERTGISSLKVNFNNVFGYYIEITNTHKEKIPPEYIRKQTMVNAERFITPELKEFEDKILHAEENILALETRLFNELRLSVAVEAGTILKIAQIVSTLDCLSSFAEIAVDFSYVRPVIDEGTVIDIRDGRHPVIERLLPPEERYTANDVFLDTTSDQILIVTGPNMSGKSSYLRQTGLIVLLAQIGSFVPAREARIGIVDRIYTRVGASDNISSGESTFLVEMHEAANIVNTATSRSLILLDEVGRGTSTFDGISIAWALTEYIHNRLGAKTLFATHYHELNELAELFPRIRNYKVEVREYGDKVLFLHKVTPGFADHSYGIQVAQMAGLPEEVTERAKNILRNLEGSELRVHGEAGEVERTAGKRTNGRIAPRTQPSLFDSNNDTLRQELNRLEVEKMTPLEALQKLAELKEQINR